MMVKNDTYLSAGILALTSRIMELQFVTVTSCGSRGRAGEVFYE